jgi:hypothetical protein
MLPSVPTLSLRLSISDGWTMTFWLARTDTDAAYVLADSAVTYTNAQQAVGPAYSSFSEIHVWDAPKHTAISEAAAKISELANDAFVYAGGVDVGDRTGFRYGALRQEGVDPAVALQRALKEHARTGRVADCAAACIIGGRPQIVIGSSRDAAAMYTDRASSRTLEDFLVSEFNHAFDQVPGEPMSVEEKLMLMTAVLQSFSAREYLLEKARIGGVFQSLAVSDQGIIRCPDCAYLDFDPIHGFNFNDVVAVYQREGLVAARVARTTESAFQIWENHKLLSMAAWSETIPYGGDLRLFINNHYRRRLPKDAILEIPSSFLRFDVQYVAVIWCTKRKLFLFPRFLINGLDMFHMNSGGLLQLALPTFIDDLIKGDKSEFDDHTMLASFIRPTANGVFRKDYFIPLDPQSKPPRGTCGPGAA